MKQTIVIKLSMNDQKSRSKALKIAVGISGVESAALIGDEKDQVQVVGEGIDSVELTHLLRKNMARAELVSVCEDKKEEVKKDEAPTPQPAEVVWYAPPYNYYPPYQYVQVRDRSYDSGCTIMSRVDKKLCSSL